MLPIDDTTYKAPSGDLDVFIGDPKQLDFYPRVKLEKWGNEVNFSVGVISDGTGDVLSSNDQVVWTKGDTTTTFYPLKEDLNHSNTLDWIRESYISPQRIAAEYEVDRHFNWRPTIRSHFTDRKAMMYYGYYKASDFITDIDIPEVRLSSTQWNDPMIMDKGLPLVDVHYKVGREDLQSIHDNTVTAIAEVLKKYGIDIIEKENSYKLYFKDGDKEVKFYSGYWVGGHYYYYVNLDCDYNEALRYTGREARNDPYAYGLRTLNPDIPDSVIDEIITRYAELQNMTLNQRDFTPDEEAVIAKVQQAHDENWVKNAVRDDVYKLTAEEGNENGFEFDITLATKPASNVYPLSIQTKELNFFKQDDEVDVYKDVRAPRVINSYAVYHASKRDNEYQAGKAFHIYRPYVTDAVGTQVWADMDIDVANEVLNITIPQDFIDNAVYPITIDPAFGYSTAGASSTISKDFVLQTEATASASGNLVAIAGAIIPASGGNRVAGIYNSAGTSLLVNGTEGTATMSPSGWEAIKVTTQYLASGTYRLAWTSAGTASYEPQLKYDTGSGTSYTYSSTYSATLPSDVSGSTTQSSRSYSIYAVSGYQFPIMVGSQVAMASSARYMPMMGATDLGWTTTQANAQQVSSDATMLHDMKFVLTTAPSAGNGRTISIQDGSNNTNIAFDITDTATSGSALVPGAIITSSLPSVKNTPIGTATSSTVNRWRFMQTGAKQRWFFGTAGAMNTSAARYVPMQGTGNNSSQSAGCQVMPESGTITNFRVRAMSAISTGSYAVELWVNNAATSPAITLTLDSSNQEASSSSSVTLAKGDLIQWRITPTGTPTAVTMSGSCEYLSDVAGNGVLLGGFGTSAVSNVNTLYNGWYGDGANNATEANVQALGAAMTVTRLYGYLSSAPGAGSPTKARDITLRSNAANTSATVSITSTSTTGEWNGTVSIADDDLLVTQFLPSNTPANSQIKYGYVFHTTLPVAPSAGVITQEQTLMTMGVGS